MTAAISDKLRRATVGIAGLGGLGSTVAAALARAGVGQLIIADFDSVEQSNLTRQQYFVDQIGKSKVECTIENLSRINADVKVTGHCRRLDAESVPVIFAQADVIAECFDKAEEKQMIVETVLTKMDKPIVVTVSGLAGYGNSNAIQTRRVSDRLILVGDNERGIDSEPVLTAPRVGIAACHQANAILEVIIDETKK
ncbi:MAG: sulfur carrier protein ThiS adenylyltransferase ThiF [Planctomycetota bacterium]|jgi:sulfur carrier protein ThiS adenylyltransferase